MNIKYLQIIILAALIIGIFFAFYLRKTPEIVISPQESRVESPTEDFPRELNLPSHDEFPNTEPSDIDFPFEKAPKEQIKYIPPTFKISVNENEAFNVGIFGESLGFDIKTESYDQEVLLNFFKMLQGRQALAIFFTGSFISNVKQERLAETSNSANVNLYRSLPLNNQYRALTSNPELKNGVIPLFPTLNSNDKADDARLVAKQFDLAEPGVFDENFGYTVSIGQAFFAVITTESSLQTKFLASDSYSKALQKWLKDVLSSAKKDHAFLFVIGHNPAFFSSTIFSDKNTASHDQFWKILVENGVRAYFSSREHFYDRSFRYGVWQIISSGGEIVSFKEGMDTSYFHCLMLTIPVGSDKAPKVQVLDIDGNVIDSFELKKKADPLYQMRISKRLILRFKHQGAILC